MAFITANVILPKLKNTLITMDRLLNRLFGFDRKYTSIRTEILAGITSFLTMAYIPAVNPAILSTTGMDKGALFTATILASVVATLLMALYAKLPYGLAPGMGLTAFFAYTVCLSMGYSWQFALTAVLIEGLLFILLTITNLREKIVDAIPDTLKQAIGVGIGLFIAFIGLQNAHIIVKNDSTLVSMGDITSGPALLSLIGLLIMSILLVKKVKGALMLSIIITTLIGLPMGITKFSGLMSTPPSIEPIFCQFEWDKIFTKDLAIVVFTFLFVDMFDTIGTLVGVATKTGMVDGNGRIIRLKQAFMTDAIGTTAGAMLGTSTVTTTIESAAGISEGGRSGLTAFVIAVCFILSLFFAPFFMAVPAAATAPVMMIIGLMMMSSVMKIDLTDYSESIPAFVCMLFIPMAYSISDGIMLGMISYVLINLLTGKYRKLTTGMYILAAILACKLLI